MNSTMPWLRGISSGEERDEALLLLEELLDDYDKNIILIDAITHAVERYETKQVELKRLEYMQEQNDPAIATLRVLMDQHQLNTTDFENEIGKRSMVSQVLNGQKRLTFDHIKKLSKRFEISPAYFF
ncbi:transcriptional regulator [Pseudidiomarina aestuarii]|uniref:Transcriptional regulator n=2 Tax=Pseudidiomarina aestuarii TaxID=624146 RepID=A0A7Z6ZW01_9GAMM|nr:transcriptional regulator [Pseudidiomarina aestuarii]